MPLSTLSRSRVFFLIYHPDFTGQCLSNTVLKDNVMLKESIGKDDFMLSDKEIELGIRTVCMD